MRENLFKERKKKKFTQAEVAKIISVTERHYQRLERGEADGSLKVWKKLSKIFNKSIDYLIKNTKEPDGNQVEINTLKE